MDTSKIRKITIFILLLLSASIVSAGNWQNYTSRKFATQFKIIHDSLYIVTDGGLMIATGPTVKSEVILNNDGLGTNQLSDIILDDNNQVWLSGMGHLITQYQGMFRPYLLFDNDDEQLSLTTLEDEGDQLWLGCSFGLVLFSKVNDNGQIEDSYTMFGNLNPEPKVNDILVRGDSIWLATTSGLAWADKSDLIQLKSPFSWRTISLDDFPEMLTDTVRSVVYFDGDYYFSTTRRMFRIQFDSMTQEPSLIMTDIGFVSRVHNLTVMNDSLFVLFDYGFSPRISVVHNDTHTPLTTAGLPGPPDRLVNYQNRYWVNTLNEGIYYWDGSTFVPYLYIGLPGNDITDVTVDISGDVFAGVRNEAFVKKNDDFWDILPVFISSNTTELHTDLTGQAWLGTRGDGVSLLVADSIAHYEETNSPLFGNNDNVPSSYGYVYISGMADDGRYMYFSCYRAANGYPLVIADMTDLDNRLRWDSVGVAQGLNNTFIISLDYGAGRVAVGTESDGVYECAVGDDPFQSTNT